MKEHRIWERTEKDFLKDRLEERLEEEKQRRLERKRKEAEQAKERDEAKMMKENDYNITSDIEMANNQDEEASESSDDF